MIFKFIFVTFSILILSFSYPQIFFHIVNLVIFHPEYIDSGYLASIFRQWVPREHNSSHNFIPIYLKLCTCFLHSLKICICFSYKPCLLSLFQPSTAKNEINLFNDHVLIMAPATFAPAGATSPSAEFWLNLFFHFFHFNFVIFLPQIL